MLVCSDAALKFFVSWLHSNENKYGFRYDINVIGNDRNRVRGFKEVHTSYVPIVV